MNRFLLLIARYFFVVFFENRFDNNIIVNQITTNRKKYYVQSIKQRAVTCSMRRYGNRNCSNPYVGAVY